MKEGGGATWNLKSRGSYLKVSEESSKVIQTPSVCEMHNLVIYATPTKINAN